MSEAIPGEPIKNFTTVVPHWQRRVTPVELHNATNEQLDAMKVTVSNTNIGEYTLVLALRTAGLDDSDIVRLSELSAFVSYQIRVVAGLRLMAEVA